MIYRIWLLYSRPFLIPSMSWRVSNYSLQAMDKTNSCILLFVVILKSLCNSQDYSYDDYNYDDYDYNNQQPEDYTDDYSQELNDYYDQNVLAPPNPPRPLIPHPIPPPPPPPMPMHPGQHLLNSRYVI